MLIHVSHTWHIKSPDELGYCLGLGNIQRGRLKLFGHIERMDKDSWVKKCREIIVGHWGGGGGGEAQHRVKWKFAFK